MASDPSVADATANTTRALLLCSLVAGPAYMGLSLIQAFTRPGFDITRHALSLLSNGDFGWLQIANFTLGFPVGTPADATAISGKGMMHFAFGGAGFLAVIAACFVFARRFSVLQRRGWAIYSIVVGIVFLAAFAGVSSGSGNSWVFVGFLIGVTLLWLWISLLSVHLRSELLQSDT